MAAASGNVNEAVKPKSEVEEILSSSTTQRDDRPQIKAEAVGRNPVEGPESKASPSQRFFGYNLFPERRSNERNEGPFKGGRDNFDKMKCERKVYNCIKNSPLVKLMLSALKSSGCEVDIRRHLSCEYCDQQVNGGYDPELNQVVICQNMVKTEGVIQGVLTHELIHMFDNCRAEMDFKNLRHLACTEIRAANLTHCSFMTAWLEGHASPWNVSRRHAECVKAKAVSSVVAVREVSVDEARAVVDSVFDRCYNDLEPIGRRVRRNSADHDKCYFERHHYGYGA